MTPELPYVFWPRLLIAVAGIVVSAFYLRRTYEQARQARHDGYNGEVARAYRGQLRSAWFRVWMGIGITATCVAPAWDRDRGMLFLFACVLLAWSVYAISDRRAQEEMAAERLRNDRFKGTSRPTES